MRKKLKLLSWIPLLGMWLALGGQAVGQTHDMSSPDSLIQSMTDDVMKTVKSDADMQKGDLNKIAKLVDAKVLPYADLQKSTRLVVGRSWKEASEDQRKQLAQQFKDLLFYTYSGAVAQIRNQEIKILPFRAPAGATDVVVNTKVINLGPAQALTLDYRLTKTAAGWKVYDVSIGGVSIIANYRNQFQGIISQRGLDGLIKELKQRNQQLAPSK